MFQTKRAHSEKSRYDITYEHLLVSTVASQPKGDWIEPDGRPGPFYVGFLQVPRLPPTVQKHAAQTRLAFILSLYYMTDWRQSWSLKDLSLGEALNYTIVPRPDWLQLSPIRLDI